MIAPTFETKRLQVEADLLAPDSSEIRLLPKLAGGSLCHCTLPPKAISKYRLGTTVLSLHHDAAVARSG
jgi:hypothetical protein